MKQDPYKVSVVIPALNEEQTIAGIVSRILTVNPDYEVVVVDDGSNDKTATNAAAAGAMVIRHAYNLGNGASVTSGSLHASGDVVVMIDADGQHPPENIPELVSYLDEYDMAVGARTTQSKTSKFRNLGNYVLNHLGSWIAQHQIDDLTSGFRAIKKEVLLEYIHLFPARYSYPTTITMALILGRHFVKYVPISNIQARKHGSSGISPMSDFFRFINIMMRILIMFSPQRFFFPLALVTFLVGIAIGIYQIKEQGGVFGSSVLLSVSGIIFFCFGLVSEQLAILRRQKNETTPLRKQVTHADK
ncbi:glycosyltransferase family 2 protein [Thalassospira lucentensis]|uniref:glycosyltransferase family 2 protein n=1 Tax=Thalassospira lucentensis TaxID=168935 RepID=UPI003D2F0F87